jgi:Domain of unknown function (DUF4159)
MKGALIAIVLAAATSAALVATARSEPQRFGGGRRADDGPPIEYQGNTPYDGRFVFVRVRYATGGFRREPPWHHDYPRGEVHFSKILKDITLANVRTDGSNILGLDDPELFNYPIAYMAEPGYWDPTDKEAENLRAFLKKGGFLIFDDFRVRDNAWANLQEQMRRVLPEARWIDLGDGSQSIWHSFFEIRNPMSLEPHPTYAGWGLHPSYWGLFENNDPSKRLMVIANVDGDISEYWEWSGTGFAPVNLDNEAYKYGINYFIYGITH